MQSLALAIRISEIADEAAITGKPVDVGTTAHSLCRKHPEAHATEAQIAEALTQEVVASTNRQCKVFVMPNRRRLSAEHAWRPGKPYLH
jgi:hypothetical protein